VKYSILAVLGVCLGACLPIAIGWNGQSHSGFWQLAQAENTMALEGLKTIPSHFGTKETIGLTPRSKRKV